ncbi:MAG: ABC transporter substrate-binding protein [Alphaproteobacteria bacterium]|nr:ABC transporter substrate-binding protein [Alphaproteobacteria bacterium]
MKNIKITIITAFIFIFSSQIYAADIKLAVLKYGTVNWELNVIKEHKLDEKYNLNIDVTYLTNKNASAIALMSKAVDMIVTDWVWVSRQRENGKDFSLIPYSTAAGAIMVPEDSSIKNIEDLKDAQIGIAGGSIDKSWILIRAYTMKVYGYDLAKYIEPAYAAPPLINGMAQKGELDGALNYWNYTARLEALNFRKIVAVEDILMEIGIENSLPLIGYVFSQKWAKNNTEAIQGFIAASNEAREILKNNDEEWERIKNITGAKNTETLIALRDGFRKGIPQENFLSYKNAIETAFKILAEIGGKDLVGNNNQLSDGVIWSK